MDARSPGPWIGGPRQRGGVYVDLRGWGACLVPVDSLVCPCETAVPHGPQAVHQDAPWRGGIIMKWSRVVWS